MNKKIQKNFLKLKVPLIKQNKNSKKTLIINRNRFDQVLRSLWCASILNRFKKNDVILITNKKYKFTNQIYKNFGVNNKYNVSLKKLILNDLFLSFYYFIFSIYKYFYFSQKGIDKFIKLFEVKNIYLGLLIHESYIKEKKYFLDKNFLLPKFFFFKIFYSYILVIYFEKYINQLNINNIILSKKEYFDIDSIIFLIAKKKRIKTIIVSQEKVLIDKNVTFNETFYDFTLKEIKKKISKKKVDLFIKNKFNGLTDRDSRYSLGQKKKFNNEDFKKIFKKNLRKTILFCPHVFSDSCSATGPFLYRDFFEYFEKTLEIIYQINDINWIIKLHPTRFFYNEKAVSKKFKKLYEKENVHFISDKYNTLSILKFVDAVVTGKGTIILEATSIGKKVLAYKHNRFHKTNIYIKYKSKKDYKKKLEFKNFNFKVQKKNRHLSKKLLYLYSKKAYFTEDNLLDDIRNKTIDEQNNYYKKLLNSLTKNHNMIYKSKYYNKLIRILL